REQSLSDEEKILLDCTSSTMMQIDSIDKKQLQESSTNINAKLSHIESVIRQSTTAPKSTKIEIETNMKDFLTSNKNRINLTPMEITQVAPTLKIINTISNIKLESQGNPHKNNGDEYHTGRGQLYPPAK
ncbi:11257_t:CDS:2, partial [Dentiscutata erythropus]